MKQKHIEFNGFLISQKLVNERVSFPNSEGDIFHNQFKITIKPIGSGQIKRIYFNYYDSQTNAEKGITELNNEGLLFAFHSFLQDTQIREQDFKSFCAEFGYSTDSIKAFKVFRACKNATKKAKKIGLINDEKINFLLEELSKKGIE